MPGIKIYFKDGVKKVEGELSYHTRVREGSCSIFLKIQTAEVYAISDGRIAKLESFYRNRQGEEFNYRNIKWDNYWLNDEYGGTKIL